MNRKTPKPKAMAVAATQSLRSTRPDPMTAMYENTKSSSVARIGCTRARLPKCKAVTWNTNPRIMLATPTSQIGWRTR